MGRQVLRALVAALEDASATRLAVLDALGLGSHDLSPEGPRLPVRAAGEVYARALRFSADPALGLHWGERLDERSFGPSSHLLAHANSLRTGFALLQRFEPLLCDARTLELEERTNTFAVRMVNVHFPDRELARFASELLTSGTVTMVRWFCAGASPLAAHFAYAAPIHRAEYRRIFGRVRFDQPLTELVFERALLDRPSPYADHEMHAAFLGVAEQRLVRLTRGAPYAARLREYLLAHWTERPTMEAAARVLALSDRSLRRQLALESTTYRAVEYGTRATVAKQLLFERGLSTEEVAHQMGFSDAATFHRAFKAWTGITLSAFRERARSSGLH